jgi:hypothetical protein
MCSVMDAGIYCKRQKKRVDGTSCLVHRIVWFDFTSPSILLADFVFNEIDGGKKQMLIKFVMIHDSAVLINRQPLFEC